MPRLQQILFAVVILAVAFCHISHSQPVASLSAAELQMGIDKLNVLSRVLYIGAHPDDENTALLAWLAKERRVDVAYLSLTRGDGGQNLIGSEQGELMGVIRTQELLAARRIDGARQFFTRAIDFGYSKSAEESLEKWGHEEVLGDMVWIIRRFKPDVIISRFATSGGGHGHHTASAILAAEAYKAAADAHKFPEQLTKVSTWRAQRLFWNAWRPEGSDVSGLLQIDIGLYNPLLGRSYTEIAAQSRSMHKSQGFGAAERRGSRIELFQLLEGEPAQNDLFDGIDLTWRRAHPEGGKMTEVLQQASKSFDARAPEQSLHLLLDAWDLLSLQSGDDWVEQKRGELAELIRACSGLWLEAAVDHPVAAPGQSLTLALNLVNRSHASWRLTKISFPWSKPDTLANAGLAHNRPLDLKTQITIAPRADISQPYWLQQPPASGHYNVSASELIGNPESAPAGCVRFALDLNGRSLSYDIPLLYRWTDPVEGDLYRAFAVGPAATLSPGENLFVFPNANPKEVNIRVSSISGKVEGIIELQLPPGWQCAPQQQPFALEKRDQSAEVRFDIRPLDNPQNGLLHAVARTGTSTLQNNLITLQYPHIPIQVLFPRAEAELIYVPLSKPERRIGYVMGAGDDIPKCLEQMGYPVRLLSDAELSRGELADVDVVMLGVRALNTRAVLKEAKPAILDFVHRGGTLIVQYNTPNRLLAGEFWPYPLGISRDRVTVEEAQMTFTKPAHPLLNRPLKISADDFDGWVQERGLYFADKWDARYESMLACNDPGEKATEGGLLYTRYGKGVFIFTSYAWFRQLPAGVPGAYRVFNNMIQAGR